MSQSILILKHFDSKAKYPWEKLAMVQSQYIHLTDNWIEWNCVGQQMATFYPVWRQAHYAREIGIFLPHS